MELSPYVSIHAPPVPLAAGSTLAGLVKVDAAALRSALEKDGHIAVYGITFDTGKATLRPDSAPAFEEITE